MEEIPIYKQKLYSNDNVLNCINVHFIKLKDEERKKQNIHLKSIIVDGLIKLMKKDELFNDTYRHINYAGSFFKGTKVGKPDEYDLDLTIHLPLNYKTLQDNVETDHTHYGFAKIKVTNTSKTDKWEKHSKILNSWLDPQGYLDQAKFRSWMQKVMTKTYDQLEKIPNEKNFKLTVNNRTYVLKPFKQSGPAFTVSLIMDNHHMDVDIVPCLEFEGIKLKGYKKITDTFQKLIVVPKPTKDKNNNILWRLSFYDQEKQILADSEVGKMKPIIRMLKKLRDKQNLHCLKSYFIETLFLHEFYERKSDIQFFRASQTAKFMHMLNQLSNVLKNKNLPFFWHEKHNLFSDIDSIILDNCHFRLKKILQEIEKFIISRKYIIAEQILTDEEMTSFKNLDQNETSWLITFADTTSCVAEKSKLPSSENMLSDELMERPLIQFDETNILDIESTENISVARKETESLFGSEGTFFDVSEVDSPTIVDSTTDSEVENVKLRVNSICRDLPEISRFLGQLPTSQIKRLRIALLNFLMTSETFGVTNEAESMQ